jgi:hypothetical protein
MYLYFLLLAFSTKNMMSDCDYKYEYIYLVLINFFDIQKRSIVRGFLCCCAV